jgi:predicted RND superfamily exporter protein
MDQILEQIASLNNKYYRLILGIALIISSIAVYGITKLQINSSWLDKLGDNMEVVSDYKFVDKTMGGSGNFEILFSSNSPDGVKTAQFVQTLEKIQSFADDQDYLVRKTYSVVDIIKDINCALHDNDKAFYELPSSNEEVSQFLLLYEISGGEELEKLVSPDVATARLAVHTDTTDTTTSRVFYDDLVMI